MIKGLVGLEFFENFRVTNIASDMELQIVKHAFALLKWYIPINQFSRNVVFRKLQSIEATNGETL